MCICKQHLRRISKSQTLNSAALWEMIFWVIICVWVCFWWYGRTEDQAFIERVQEIGYGTEELRTKVRVLYKSDLEEWNQAFIGHVTTCILFSVLSIILFLGVHYRSRCYLVCWMLLFTLTGVVRSATVLKYPRAFELLIWLEWYWIYRVYLLLVAFNLCLDIWSEVDSAEILDPPFFIPLDDPRQWRGMFRYLDHPLTLDQRDRVYGAGRHLPFQWERRYLTTPYPTWYAGRDAYGEDILILDNPAYNADVR